jgi:autotransporter-associated beta strand protein
MNRSCSLVWIAASLMVALPASTHAVEYVQIDLAAIGATADATHYYYNNPPSSGIDGTVTTHWMGNGGAPVWYRVDLKSPYTIGKFLYTTAQDKLRQLQNCSVFVTGSSSTAPADWGDPVLTGFNFGTVKTPQEYIIDPPATGRYLILYAEAFIGRGSVAELDIFKVAPPFVAANPVTGSSTYLSGNQVAADRMPLVEGYDRCCITDSATLPATPIADWTPYSTNMAPSSVSGTIAPPVGNAELSVYFWLADSTGTLPPMSEVDTITYTTNAPVLVVRDVFKSCVTNGTMAITVDDVDAGTTGGSYGEFPMAVFSRTLACPQDLEDPDATTSVSLQDAATDYTLTFTAMNVAGVTATTTVVATVQGPLYWNPANAGGGAGTWGTESWSDAQNYPGGDLVAGFWTADKPSPAIFGGEAGGRVTMGNLSRYVSRLTVTTPGYNLDYGQVWFADNGDAILDCDVTIRSLCAAKNRTITKTGPGTLTTVDYIGGNNGRIDLREGEIVAATLGMEGVISAYSNSVIRAAKAGICGAMKNKIYLYDETLFDLAGYNCGNQMAVLQVEKNARVRGQGGTVGVYGWNQNVGELTLRGRIEMEGGSLLLCRSGTSPVTMTIADGGLLDLGDGGLLAIDDGAGRLPAFAFSGDGVITNGSIRLCGEMAAAARTQTFTVADDTDAVDFAIYSDIIDGLQPGCGLTKDGAGALLLAGGNSYTGATTVAAGALQLSGSLANAKLRVDAGASFETLPGAILPVNEGDAISVSGTLDLAGTTLDVRLEDKVPVVLVDYADDGATVEGIEDVTLQGGWYLANDTDNRVVHLRPLLGTLLLLR